MGILDSMKLTRREQDALLPAYGVFVDRASPGKAAFFRTRLISTVDQNDTVDQLIGAFSLAQQA